MTSLQTASIEEIREVAARLCRDYLTGRWKVVTAEQLIVKRISGGLSNFLYYVSLPDEDASTINIENDDATNIVTDTACDGVLTVEAKNRRTTENIEIVGTGDFNGNKRLRTDSGGSSSGLNTTSLKHLHLREQEPKEVLLRIYGQTHGENALESMITESVVFALLSERNFGPKLHGIFPGGRIEQFIPARALVTTELSNSKLSNKIAEKMGEIHSLNIPMSKEPDWIWNCIDRWFRGLDAVLNQKTHSKTNEDCARFVRSVNFAEEIQWMKSLIDQGNYKVLFCHNDMQEGNILFREIESQSFRSTSHESINSLRSNCEDSIIDNMEFDESIFHENVASLNISKRKRIHDNQNNNNQMLASSLESTHDSVISNNSVDSDFELIIIDFEYCAYNYRGFDIANHFIEWTYDYTNPQFPHYYHNKNAYPNKQQRQHFIAAYLRKLNEHIENYVPSREEIEGIEQEVRLFTMFSHLFWILWSVINTTSNIEFGYWNYAVTRLREYQSLKESYIKDNAR